MTKSKKLLWVAGILSAVIIGILLFFAIRNSLLNADAEETLFGIENLQQTMQGREEPYTILEIVPTVEAEMSKAAAADIGYLIPGYEPALSTLNVNTGEWTSWQDGLKEHATAQKRREYMAGLKEQLDQFYASKGFQGQFPVVYSEYQESIEPKEGYDNRLDFDQVIRKGYFYLTEGEGLCYDVEFQYECMTTQVPEGYTGVYYYADATVLTVELAAGLSDNEEIYIKDKDIYKKFGNWGEVRDTVSSGNSVSSEKSASSGDGRSSVSDSDFSQYYLVTFKPVIGELDLGNQALYSVSSFSSVDVGDYQFAESDIGNDYLFGGNSIYYKGGFVNNEWFRRYVLNLEPQEFESFSVKVITLSVAQLNNMVETIGQLPEYDMVYLNSGITGGVSYSSDVDLSEVTAKALFIKSITGVKPCIVDASIMYQQDNSGILQYRNRGTNIFYLSAMFSQQSPSAYYSDNRQQLETAGGWDEKLLLANMVEDEDKNFVTEQIYSVFGLINSAFNQPNIYKEAGESEQKTLEGFRAVLDEIQLENQYREADSLESYTPLSTDISQAVVVRHIMNYPKRRNVEVKKYLHVLEIQPALSNEGSYELTEEMIKEWSSSKVETVEIDRITTAEFIGRIDELNEVYDLIYIGADTDQMNVNTAGNTVFNDSAMNGLIYFHTGDMRYTNEELAGQLNTEYVGGLRNNDIYAYNPVRYGGNDITFDKKKALKSFLDASYPIVVSDKLFTVQKATDGSGETIVVDEKRVDNSSYLYDFLKETLEEDRTNFFMQRNITSDSQLFQFYLNRPKVTFSNEKANGSQDANGIHYIKPGSNGRYELQYTFTFENQGAATPDTKYQCQLYVDVNADGKYSGSEELGDITITHNGQTVASNELYAGREYVVTRRVPDGYKGVLPWKVKIVQVNNPHIHNAISGYTKLQGLEQEKLEILQICRNPLGTAWWEGDYNETLEDMFNLERRLSDPKDIYYVLVYGGKYNNVTYQGIYQEFDINVTFKTISEYETEIARDPNYLSKFNMLILGFSDIYGDFSGDESSGAMGSIIDFINAGKSVLFAHDTTSYFNYKAGTGAKMYRKGTNTSASVETRPAPWHNAYSLNRYVRNLVGMDRYGILSLDLLQQGREWNSSNDEWSRIVNQGKDIAYVAGSNKQTSSALTHGYTYPIINLKDKAGGSYSYNETGVSGGFKNNYLNLNYRRVADSYDTADFFEYGNTASSNLYVTKVNSGQITEYPYSLPDEFKVSHTHAQYYQLDFTADDDRDGQTDLVVWYCLGYRTDNRGTRKETIYSISPNDVSNNYYIYNKGNITYTGVGHAGNESTVEEAKLFINTMIASYNSGIKDPVITPLSDGSLQSREVDTIYSYYDEKNNLDFSNGNTEKAYFSVSDVNFVKGTRRIGVNCYYESTEEDAIKIPYNGEEVSVKPIFDVNNPDNSVGKIYRASDETKTEVDPSQLESGVIYCIEFDKSVMGNNTSRFSVYFEAQTTIQSDTTIVRIMKTGKAYQKLDFTKVHMFELD